MADKKRKIKVKEKKVEICCHCRSFTLKSSLWSLALLEGNYMGVLLGPVGYYYASRDEIIVDNLIL